jgi:hypothetical protein
MRNFLRIAENIIVSPLLCNIARNTHLWDQYTIRRSFSKYSASRDVGTILLRFPQANSEDEYLDKVCGELEAVNYPAFNTLFEARSIIFSLMNHVSGERLGRAFITKLQPGAKIFPHTDLIPDDLEGMPEVDKDKCDLLRKLPQMALYYDRYHVVLNSQPGVIFRCGDEQVYMAPGEVWWFDNTVEHEVINNSNDDRIHLIVDIKSGTPA